MEDNRSGRRYDAKLKEQAVRMALSSGKSICCVARELGLSPHTLKDWKETHLENGGSAVALDLENQRLRRELERVTPAAGHLKKIPGHTFPGTTAKRYALMKTLAGPFPIKKL